MTRRLREVFRVELGWQLRRPLFWVMVVLAVLITWGLSTGAVRIASGDSDVGGMKAHMTSMFAQSLQLSIFFVLIYVFFFAVACGMPVIRDDEERVGDLLHSTPLRPAEYAWGKFLAAFCACALAFVAHLLFAMVFNHLVPSADAEKYRGAFALGNYLWPAALFCLPTALFAGGIGYAIGASTRRAIVVFLFPVIVFAWFLFLVAAPWLPEELPRLAEQVLQIADPSGWRWLDQTWLKVDRGVEFYNQQPLRPDAAFLMTRLAYAAIGLAAVYFAQRRLPTRQPDRAVKVSAEGFTTARPHQTVAPVSLADLAMTTRQVGWWSQIREVARIEGRNLLFQPGLYLFAPLIVLNTVFGSIYRREWLETQVLVTSGHFAVSSFTSVSFWLVFLLLFYTVESLQRERASGLAPIHRASPIRTFAVLSGKALANSLVAAAVLAATFLGGVIALAVQGKTGIELAPFALVWGLLLFPTFLLWTSFVSFVHALTGSRYASYAICIGVVVVTGLAIGYGKLNWATNWTLWGSLIWSDLSTFELDRSALVLNRLLALSAAIGFLVLAVRLYPRVETDPQLTLHRLAPTRLWRTGLKLAAIAAIPTVIGLTLWFRSYTGMQGKVIERKLDEYRQKNFITWFETDVPRIAGVDLHLTIDPEQHRVDAEGSYRLLNHHASELTRFPVTIGPHWSDVSWTLDGTAATPIDRAGLQVFTPSQPLGPGSSLQLGFRYTVTLPDGITHSGGGMQEFVLPSSIVLTSFGPTFAPWIGFMDEIHGDEKLELEPRDYPDDAYLGPTPSAFGADEPYPARIEINGPADLTFNSVGRKVDDRIVGERRTVVWETDYPVTFFNVVGGRWTERLGSGTALYHHPTHTFNVEEMGGALDAARRYYGEWFMPYPWERLKVSQFAGLASYAQGFPTNITFSEAIGFLTQSDAKSHTAFLVTAHESAHQWWGNLINPGKLPGGNLLSEGTAHFSTVMLIDQVLGQQARLETLKRLEEQYGRDRVIDSERALVRIDGTRQGDTTVTYDKAGWVFTMLQDLMGRERNLAAIQEFFRIYHRNPDHPVLQDFIAVMRQHAPDPAAFDDFVAQWFYQVVVPEYQFSQVTRTPNAAGTGWQVTATLENIGTGRMPVDVAAAVGERFEQQTDEQAAQGPAALSAQYREARTSVVLGAGESVAITIDCAFEPDRLMVDPDVRVLQLRRKDRSIYKF